MSVTILYHYIVILHSTVSEQLLYTDLIVCILYIQCLHLLQSDYINWFKFDVNHTRTHSWNKPILINEGTVFLMKNKQTGVFDVVLTSIHRLRVRHANNTTVPNWLVISLVWLYMSRI